MCYNLLYCCEGPPDQPGFMDLYCSTTVHGRQSTGRVLSRSCATNTQQFAANGHEIEPLWQAERTTHAQRRILANVAAWGGNIYQRELYQPHFFDYDDPRLTSYFMAALGSHTPLVDPTGDGWTVHASSSGTGENLATFNMGLPFGDELSGLVRFDPLWTTFTPSFWYGVVFWFTSPTDYYRAIQKSGSFVIERVSGASVTTLASVATTVVGINLALDPATGQITANTLSANIGPGQRPPVYGVFARRVLFDPEGRADVLSIELRSSGKKHFLSIYSTEPSVVGEHEDARYAGGFMAAGAGGLWVRNSLVFSPGDWVNPLDTFPGPEPEPLAVQEHHVFGTGRSIFQPFHTWRVDTDAPLPGARTSWGWATEQALGHTAAPAFAKHGFPMAAGYVLRSVGSPNFIREEPTFGWLWEATATHALIAGDVTFSESGPPFVNETVELFGWTTQVRQWSAIGEQPTDDSWRAAGSAAMGSTNPVTAFESLPDLGAFIVAADERVPGFGTRIGWGAHPNLQIASAASAAVAEPALIAVTNAGTFTIYGAGGGVIYQRSGMGAPRIRAASDRFFYLEGVQDSNPATLATISLEGLPSSTAWMISVDGQYRFPCVAVDKAGSYRDRPNAEFGLPGHGAHLFRGGDVDCIKGPLPHAPRLGNPAGSVSVVPERPVFTPSPRPAFS